MTPNTPTLDYGEPWCEQSPPHPIAKSKGVYWLNPEQFNRAVTCVNACAGMADPAKEIKAMREAIREAHEAIKVSPYPDQQALAKLQPYLNQ
jgi:hypothetical protein